MARALNKNRMRDTRILVIITLLIGVSGIGMFTADDIIGCSMDITGYLLVAICAIGRVYTTAYIGGNKNQELVTHGPYSLCRNPLYFFSLLGVIGVGLMTNSFTATLLVAGGFIASYTKLIEREEHYLAATFGETFESYKRSTPKLIPFPRLANYPAELVFKSRNFNRALFDALWWFAPLPLFELGEHLRNTGLINPPISLF